MKSKDYSAFIEKTDEYLKNYSKNNRLSAVLQIHIKDELIYNAAIGMADYENNIPFNKGSMFSFYSISKPFCAMGIMKLWDKGLIDLDAHPSKYLKEAQKLHPEVTLRYILQHRSGVPDFEQTEEFSNKYRTKDYKKLREHLTIISDYPNLFKPGTEHFYANVNYNILSLIIEELTGMDYKDYMEKEVLAPLGMKTALIDLPDLSVPNRVQGYGMENGRIIPVERYSDWMRGGGDIIGTADDMYCLNKAIKHRLLLSNEAWDLILTPNPVNNMGFGCTIYPWQGRNQIRHNGGATGFRTLHIQLPEDDFDLILLTNYGFDDIRTVISDAIGEIFYGKSENMGIEMDKGYANI